MNKFGAIRESIYAQVVVVLNALLVFAALFLVLRADSELSQVYVLLLTCSMVGGIGSLLDLGTRDWMAVIARGNLAFSKDPLFQLQLRRVAVSALLGGLLIGVYAWVILGANGLPQWRLTLVFLVSEIIVEGLYRCFYGLVESKQKFYISRTIEVLGRTLHLVLCSIAVLNERSSWILGLAFLLPPVLKLIVIKIYFTVLNLNASQCSAVMNGNDNSVK